MVPAAFFLRVLDDGRGNVIAKKPSVQEDVHFDKGIFDLFQDHVYHSIDSWLIKGWRQTRMCGVRSGETGCLQVQSHRGHMADNVVRRLPRRD